MTRLSYAELIMFSSPCQLIFFVKLRIAGTSFRGNQGGKKISATLLTSMRGVAPYFLRDCEEQSIEKIRIISYQITSAR